MNQPYRIIEDLANPVLPASSAWGSPDSSILRDGRRPPPIFPVDVLGPWKDWVREAADGAGAPVDYVAGALLASLGTLVGNSRSVSPWVSWIEPSVLWIGAVGDPSTGKTPAMYPVLKALRKVEADLGENFPDIHRDWEAKKELAKAIEDTWKSSVASAAKNREPAPEKPIDAVAPDEPTLPRLIVTDITPEALAVTLAANPKGVLNHRDELTGWLSNFKRYSSGDSRAMWIEAFGAYQYTIDRKTSRAIRIPRMAISILGGIQPDRLHNVLLGADDDGLASRFLWFWPDAVPVKRPSTFASNDFIAESFSRLSRLDGDADGNGELLPRNLELAHDASDAFQTWWKRHVGNQQAVSGMLKSAWGKMPGLLLRLSLVLELGWWSAAGGKEPEVVSLKAIENAIHLTDDYVKPMSERVYGDTALPIEERNATTIARWLLFKGHDRLNARDFRRTAGLPGLHEPQAVDAAIAILVEANWLKPSAIPDGPGRKAKNFDVNPATKQFKT